MTLSELIDRATDKSRFNTLKDYIDFARQFLDYIEIGIQARIISQNENQYEFLQYKKDGNFSISRPINSHLMYTANTFQPAVLRFWDTVEILRGRQSLPVELRKEIPCIIYTLQQTIGATLDALPSGRANQARKVNGDLFERLICLLIADLNIDCLAGTMQVPVKDDKGIELFRASYQHDVIIKKGDEIKVIGSVKTSSKDRIDKIFLDKFLYSRLTNTALPHVAIFLNDVQRKKTKKESEYSISTTFLPGHFKAYTIKLNPLDGVYYCDIRPNMSQDPLLAQHIKTIDCLFCDDLWAFLEDKGQSADIITNAENENRGF